MITLICTLAFMSPSKTVVASYEFPSNMYRVEVNNNIYHILSENYRLAVPTDKCTVTVRK